MSSRFFLQTRRPRDREVEQIPFTNSYLKSRLLSRSHRAHDRHMCDVLMHDRSSGLSQSRSTTRDLIPKDLPSLPAALLQTLRTCIRIPRPHTQPISNPHPRPAMDRSATEVRIVFLPTERPHPETLSGLLSVSAAGPMKENKGKRKPLAHTETKRRSATPGLRKSRTEGRLQVQPRIGAKRSTAKRIVRQTVENVTPDIAKCADVVPQLVSAQVVEQDEFWEQRKRKLAERQKYYRNLLASRNVSTAHKNSNLTQILNY